MSQEAIQPDPVIRAEIRLLTREEGGRRSPLIAGSRYRPNHNFFGADDLDMSVGEIRIPDDRDIHGGETFEATIRLLYWPALDEIIRVGRTWRIQEGHQLVATGRILEILAPVWPGA